MGLSMNGGATEIQYRVPLIAKLLHSVPHFNLTFHRTNDTFRPTDQVYLEVSGCIFSPASVREFDNLIKNR